MITSVEIRVFGRKILFRMPKNEADIQFVKGITYARWNQNQFVWEVPHYPGNLEKLMDYFGDRITLIEKAKGNNDRYTILSKKILELLREYFKKEKPHYWVFEGLGSTKEKPVHYTTRSIQQIYKKALSKTKITKHVTVHTLRHSFATHLLENGTDLRYIQSLLGHSNSKTTEVYAHITTKGFSQIISPLDKLDI